MKPITKCAFRVSFVREDLCDCQKYEGVMKTSIRYSAKRPRFQRTGKTGLLRPVKYSTRQVGDHFGSGDGNLKLPKGTDNREIRLARLVCRTTSQRRQKAETPN